MKEKKLKDVSFIEERENKENKRGKKIRRENWIGLAKEGMNDIREGN